ncbi:hypothetical protein [Phreatobacter sp.]|uniref:hypothetical protein n=1 Tax=Phreatobacter sp. TaxID=1966341 RepID=UPI003F71340B
MSTPARCKLSLHLSPTVPLAVIARRGPRRLTCLILWDIRKDSFAVGHWYRGTVEIHDLSPGGEWLLSFCSKGYDSWTVLSKPPWLTAHGLWHIGDHWGAGGYFLSDSSIVLHRIGAREGPAGSGPAPLPRGMTARVWTEADGARPVDLLRWHRAFGASDRQDYTAQSDFANGWVQSMPDGLRLEQTLLGDRRLVDAGGRVLGTIPPEVGALQFNPWGRRPGMVYSLGGRLMLLPFEALPQIAHVPDIRAASIELADFTALSFEARPAPDWAQPARGSGRTGGGSGWDPLAAADAVKRRRT